jgi:hypothetical protein
MASRSRGSTAYNINLAYKLALNLLSVPMVLGLTRGKVYSSE